MIYTIVRNGFRSLRRDRGALVLSFILPVAFFTIFGFVFGGMRSTGTPRVSVLVVDEDHSPVSERLIRGLQHESSLLVSTHPEAKPEAGKGQPVPPDYTAATAETAVKQGVAPVALIIPNGFGANPITFGPATNRKAFTLLHDSSDPIRRADGGRHAPKSRHDVVARFHGRRGHEVFRASQRRLDPQQRRSIDADLSRFHDQMQRPDQQHRIRPKAAVHGGIVALSTRDVVGENKRSPMIAFYAAGYWCDVPPVHRQRRWRQPAG